MSNKALRKAWGLIKEGNKQEAYELLQQVLKDDPDSADTLFLISFTPKSREAQIKWLKSALSIDSSHKKSLQRLAKLQKTSKQTNIKPETELGKEPSAEQLDLGELVNKTLSKLAGDEQDPIIVEKVSSKVRQILTANEDILYIAVRHNPIRPDQNLSPDCVVATNRRFIIYTPKMFGGASMKDYIWRDLKDVRIDEGVMRATLIFETTYGTITEIDNLPKLQARKLYTLSQEREEDMIEERRKRQIEESKATASQIHIGGKILNEESQNIESSEDFMARLKQLKDMLDADLISQAEYDAKKFDILSRM